MIKKLQRKLIFINMFLVSLVLIVAFSGIVFVTRKNLADRSIVAMHEISQSYSTREHPLFGEDIFNDNEYSYLSTFAIETNDERLTFTVNGYDVAQGDLDKDEEEYLNTLINKVYRANKAEGVLAEENLRFYSVSTMLGRRIIFLNKEYEDATLLDLMWILFAIALVTLALIYVISVLFAKISVAPVEKSIKQQRQLISDVSHELKTPITVISANADILASHPDSTISEQIKWVEYIKTETSRMTNLIANMLFLARNDEGEVSETHRVISVSDIVYAAALPFESVCFEREKTLDLEIKPDIYVKGDETSLKQLVAILVDNACKYSSENGHIKVILTDEQDKALISVWNSGAPIPPENIPHLFDRFYRVDKSRSRSEGGYGLGLSIAKSIAEAHQGKLSVVSSMEHGTMFTFTVKRVKPQSQPKATPQLNSGDDN